MVKPIDNVHTGLNIGKCLNKECFLEKFVKMNLPRKVQENHSQALKSTWTLLFSVRLNPLNDN